MMRQRRQTTITLVPCCYGNHKAYVLDPSTGQPTGTEFSTPTGLLRGAQISSTEAILGGNSDKTSVISLTRGTVTKTMTGGHNGGHVNCTANLVSDDLRVVTGGDDNCIAIWDVNAGSVLSKLQGHTSNVYSLVNHPFLSEFLFGGSNDNSIRQWDHNQETCVNTFTGHTGYVRGLCYDPTHQIVFSGSADKTVKGWDHKSGENVITLTLPSHVHSILYREESEENQLAVPVCGEKIHLFDLRLFSENGTTQELRSWNHGHSGNVYDICDVPDQNMFVTSGWSDYHIKAWRENGTCVWDWTGPSHMYGIISFVDDYEGWISATGPPRPPTSSSTVGEYLSSDPKCQENKEFLIAEAERLHDTKIEISYGSNGESTSFHCYQSLISSSTLHPFDPTEFGTVVTLRVIMDSDDVSLTEELFLGILLGTVEITEEIVQNNVTELLDFCEILDKLNMKRVLWFIAERIREVLSSDSTLETSYSIFRGSFSRFESVMEEEEEGEEELKFDKVISLACFEGLRSHSSGGKKFPLPMKRWLMRNFLIEFAQAGGPPVQLRSHPELSMIPESVVCLPPHELLAEDFATFAETTTNPNVELCSGLEERGTSVVSHIETLVLSFDFFKMMLRFGGREQDQFVRRRQLVIDGLSTHSLELLSHFSYVGSFPDNFPVNEALLDVILILGKAEEDSNERLINYCVGILKTADTSDAAFLQSLLNLGNAFEDIQARTEILESWASQGNYTVRQLVKKLTQASESARRQFDMATVLRRMGAMERRVQTLEGRVETLESELSEERLARVELERRLES